MTSNNNSLVNLFSEFVLNSIPTEHDSIFECCDCENFLIIKGNSNYKEVLNMSEIGRKFEEKYPEIKSKNTIDLINYDHEFGQKMNFDFTFYNTRNYTMNTDTTSSFFKISDFPYGISWSKGKLLYFYFMFITSKIPTNYPYTWINYKIEVNEKNEVDFTIEDNYINNHHNVLKSAILDCFDFNLHEFEKFAKKMDLEKLILNPNYFVDFSEIEVKDFVII
jgi:hypothetical protein